MDATDSTHGQTAALHDAVFEQIALGLEGKGHVVLPSALPEVLARGLEDYLASLETTRFAAGRLGRGQQQTRDPQVRSDHIYWIEGEHPGGSAWLGWLDGMMTYLNRRLYLGLFSHESHFSRYPPGAFYGRHLDAFRGASNRLLSMVTYLNRDWLPEQGGELVLHGPDSAGELLRVAPLRGTLVLFLSAEFPHEVLPTQRTRYGVATWFRINASTGASIDPPR